MDRQARKLTSGGKEGENGSENGSELGSNTDSESEEKVRIYLDVRIFETSKISNYKKFKNLRSNSLYHFCFSFSLFLSNNVILIDISGFKDNLEKV